MTTDALTSFVDPETRSQYLFMSLEQAREAIRQPEWQVLSATDTVMLQRLETDERSMGITRFDDDFWIVVTGTAFRRKYCGPFFKKRTSVLFDCTSIEEVEEHLAHFYKVDSAHYTGLIKQKEVEYSATRKRNSEHE
ncbi:hypothetical protein [Oceanobacter mangrovi]|uniref:hypothetical protein n=1 Tax=Oceanobacter mangrovi TaxID=2862510 RepID=UPI001C8E52C8|nr:hypothetical protein [Oceanobacter mangrovi]